MEETKQGGVRNIEQVECIWNNIVDMPRLNGNGYRLLLDICINFQGHTTQKEFLEKRKWKQSSVSNTLTKLVQYEFLLCRQIPKTKKMEYYVNPALMQKRKKHRKICVDFDTFVIVWNEIREYSFMSSNNYRIFIDVLLFYEQVSSVELCEEREWKLSSTYASLKKLYEHQLLLCNMEQGQTMYSVNKKYFQI